MIPKTLGSVLCTNKAIHKIEATFYDTSWFLQHYTAFVFHFFIYQLPYYMRTETQLYKYICEEKTTCIYLNGELYLLEIASSNVRGRCSSNESFQREIFLQSNSFPDNVMDIFR